MVTLHQKPYPFLLCIWECLCLFVHGGQGASSIFFLFNVCSSVCGVPVFAVQVRGQLSGGGFSPIMCVLESQTQGIKFSSKHLFLLSHLTCPHTPLNETDSLTALGFAQARLAGQQAPRDSPVSAPCPPSFTWAQTQFLMLSGHELYGHPL